MQYPLTIWRPATFGDSHTKTTESHVALHMHNSHAKSGRELFIKGSKDAASLLVCIRNKFFAWGIRIFCEWHKWKIFRPLWPISPGSGPKLL